MRALPKPNPPHVYNANYEITRLRRYRDQVHVNPADSRNIPAVGQTNHVLIATWNIANLGVHERRGADIKVIAEILSWFEIIAVQEVADNLRDLNRIKAALPSYFEYVFNDRAGNDERSAYFYDTRRVALGPKIGEVVIVESDRKYIKLPGITRDYDGFNRNPYLVSFLVQNVQLLFANCHLFYGKQSPAAARLASMEKRQLEAYAIARWCDLRRRDSHRWTKNIFALGDFNLPKASPGDPIYDALTKRGLNVPDHDTRIPTNVSGSKDYDQIAVTPGLKSKIVDMGVFDFDGAFLPNLYNTGPLSYWRRCAKYYISDHRPLWMQYQLI